jgi:hypothetical protein
MNPLLIIIVGAIAALVLYEWAWARGEQSGRRVHAANYAALRKALAAESPKPVVRFAIPDKSEPVILHEGDTVEVVFTATRDDVPYKKLMTEVTLLDVTASWSGGTASLGVSTYVEDAS